MTKRLKSDPKPPSSLRPECFAELDRIVLKAMQRNPELRYQSAAEMFYDIQILMPERAVTSGAYLQISKHQSGSYVGPSLNRDAAELLEATSDKTQEVSVEEVRTEPTEIKPRIMSNGLVDEPTDAELGWVEERRVSNTNNDHLFDESSPPQPEVRSPARNYSAQPARNVQDTTEEYGWTGYSNEEATLHEPVRMERVLAYKDMVSEGWQANQRPIPSEVQINNDSQDDRLRRLATLVDKVNRSLWIDIATLVVAVMIGVGVGFAFLKVVFPDVISRKTVAVTPSKSYQVKTLNDE